MSYVLNVIDEIHATYFSDLSLIVESWEDAGRDISKNSLPAMVVILPSGTLQVRNGRFYDTPNIGIAFLNKVTRDADGRDNDSTAYDMRELACMFIKALNESGKVEPITNVTYTNIYERKSTILSGCWIDFTIMNRDGFCVDLPQSEP